jgi:hypothetical protein
MVSLRPELTPDLPNPFTPYPPQAGGNLKSHIAFPPASIFGLPFIENGGRTMKKTEELVVISKTYDLIP